MLAPFRHTLSLYVILLRDSYALTGLHQMYGTEKCEKTLCVCSKDTMKIHKKRGKEFVLNIPRIMDK